jgi:hypothetical protein
MIWLTWRQFRLQALISACGLGVFGVVLLVTGIRLAHEYSTSGLPACGSPARCVVLAGDFIAQDRAGLNQLVFAIGVVLVYAAPALMGMFWGAPLLTREIETGTFRLAWTQSVPRNRWIAVKLALIGLTSMATAGLLSLMVNWWAEPIYKSAAVSRASAAALNRFAPAFFGAHGIAPIGYAAFAFMLGVSAGALIRRTLPAMAAALGGFAFVQLAWPAWIRPHLMTPARATVPLRPRGITELSIAQRGQITVVGGVHKPGSWILSNQSITPAGRVYTGPAPSACLHAGPQACNAALGALHLHQLLIYQPASRFWAFQWYETGIFVVLALALAWLCAWRISRRRLA